MILLVLMISIVASSEHPGVFGVAASTALQINR